MLESSKKQKVNYGFMLEKLIKEQEGRRPRLLLHACCAPCSSSVLEQISKYFEITIYYYNPNIMTEREFLYRASELKRLIQEMGLDITVVVPEYHHEEFLEIARGLEKEPERGKRCLKCYEQRLRKTAEELLRKNQELSLKEQYDYFCTTLTISPMKDAQVLNEIGMAVAEELGVQFLPSDFKKKGGYLRSTELSKEHELYRQDYCGCEFSKAEAERKRREREIKEPA